MTDAQYHVAMDKIRLGRPEFIDVPELASCDAEDGTCFVADLRRLLLVHLGSEERVDQFCRGRQVGVRGIDGRIASLLAARVTGSGMTADALAIARIASGWRAIVARIVQSKSTASPPPHPRRHAMPFDPETLADAIQAQAHDLKATRDAFDTHQIGRGFPERFVTWFYAQAIATVLRGGHVALEIAVPKTSNTHLDMLVFNDEIAVLGENKRDGSARWIRDDVERLHHFAGDIAARFRDGHRRKLYAFIGFDCYVSAQAAAWCQGIRVPAVATFTRRSTTVFQRNQLPAGQWAGAEPNEDGYYLCWALKQINLEPQA